MSAALLCPDCALWAANRDDRGADPEWIIRVALLDVGGIFGTQYIGMFNPEPGENDEGVHAFVTAPCDGCGDVLAGTRIIATPPDATMLATAMGLVMLESVLS